MPSAIHVQLWCDLCYAEDEHVEGEYTPAVVIGNAKPRRTILCIRHMKEVYSPFHELLLSSLAEIVDGKPVPVPAGSRDGNSTQFFCPIQGCDKNTSPVKHVYTVRDHLVNVHGLPEAEAREMVGMRKRRKQDA